jgi:hypothetical protein
MTAFKTLPAARRARAKPSELGRAIPELHPSVVQQLMRMPVPRGVRSLSVHKLVSTESRSTLYTLLASRVVVFYNERKAKFLLI